MKSLVITLFLIFTGYLMFSWLTTVDTPMFVMIVGFVIYLIGLLTIAENNK